MLIFSHLTGEKKSVVENVDKEAKVTSVKVCGVTKNILKK